VKKVEFFIKKMAETVAQLKNMHYLCNVQKIIVQWCNGSTSDSGSACEGSSPSWTTEWENERFPKQINRLIIRILANC
jgi:hypothetical protein